MLDAAVNDPVIMFQKVPSVIALQDAKTYQARKVGDLRQIPLQLSIGLGLSG
jgi:hypothetical protein